MQKHSEGPAAVPIVMETNDGLELVDENESEIDESDDEGVHEEEGEKERDQKIGEDNMFISSGEESQDVVYATPEDDEEESEGGAVSSPSSIDSSSSDQSEESESDTG